jgi:dTDP-4-amino-4,6-dideoxygalactose transaminase
MVSIKGADRYTKRYKHWDMPLLGWKYNMDNIQASLLIRQLDRIEHLWLKRDALWKVYEKELSSIPNVEVLRTLPGVKHARHLLTILVPADRRDLLLRTLQGRGIGVAVNYRPIHLLEYYKKTFGYKEGDYPIAEEIGRRTISLPFYPSLRKADIQYIVKVFKETLDN